MLYGLVHSLLAAFKVKDMAHRRWGQAADRWYRLAFNLFAAITLLPVAYLFLILEDNTFYRIPFPISILFFAIQGIAVVILLYGVLQTGLWHFIGLRQLFSGEEQKHELTTDGLYRWVRHPLYTAGLMFIWFTPLMTENLLALNLALTVYIIVGARHEEQRLLADLGHQYAQYKEQVPMLIPQPWRPKPVVNDDAPVEEL